MNRHESSDLKGEGLFTALGDRQRQKILRLLRQGDHAAGELARLLEVTPATMSHHLAILKSAGLVRMRKQGQLRIYTINLSVFEEAAMLLSEFIAPKRKP